MMHIDQRKEQYSFAYVRAVAAAAGYTVDERSVDDDSVDLQISSRSKLGTVKSPKVELQAKCLGDGPFKGDGFGYALKLKNYDDLRGPDVQVARILVVVRVPTDNGQWLGGDDDGLLVRHCGYWCSLRGLAEYAGKAKEPEITVQLPRAQRFDVAGLRAMMERIGEEGAAMRVDIRDAGTVSVLRPLEIASYLRASHWKQSDVKEGQYAVWTLDGDVEAFLPLRTDTPDYALRMGDLLRVLSVVENRSQTELLADLLTTNADVVRVRLIDDDLADGSMPIEDYARTSQKARDLLLAAACSAINPRPVWPNRKPDQAVNYLRGVRMGQTERGSYVLKIISRVPPKLASTQAELFVPAGGEAVSEDVPYERSVMNTLAAGLREAESAAESAAASGTVDRFETAVGAGVSANFCEALAGLAYDGDSRRTVDVSFTWSPTRPNRVGMVSRVVIPQDRVPFLQEAARVLRERSPVDDFELAGAVVKLERAEGAATGQITLHAATDLGMRRVRVELQDSEYQLAIRAHGSDQDVRVVGRLVRRGRSFTLESPRGFTITGGAASDD